jgi:hypothetical protein
MNEVTISSSSNDISYIQEITVNVPGAEWEYRETTFFDFDSNNAKKLYLQLMLLIYTAIKIECYRKSK